MTEKKNSVLSLSIVLVSEQFSEEQRIAATDYLTRGIEANSSEAIRLTSVVLPLVMDREVDPKIALSALKLLCKARPWQASLVPQMLLIASREDQPDLVVKALGYIRDVGPPALQETRPRDGASTAYVLSQLVNSKDANIKTAAELTQQVLGLMPRTAARREAVETAVRADPEPVRRAAL